MAKVFIIWDEIPEETNFYVVELKDKQLERALRAQGQLVNSTKNAKDAEWLGEKILPDITPLDKEKAFNVKDLGIEHIVYCGFLL